MAKLLGPDFISLQVRNFSASRTFYTEMLGLTMIRASTLPILSSSIPTRSPLLSAEAKVNLDKRRSQDGV